MELAFWNTGAEEYERLRPLSYPGSHVVLICFAAGSASERDEVRRKWVPEVRYHCHDTPIVLVGFGPEAGDILDSQQDLDLGKEIGAAAYVQFNAETGAGWSDALEAVGLFSLFRSGVPRVTWLTRMCEKGRQSGEPICRA